MGLFDAVVVLLEGGSCDLVVWSEGKLLKVGLVGSREEVLRVMGVFFANGLFVHFGNNFIKRLLL